MERMRLGNLTEEEKKIFKKKIDEYLEGEMFWLIPEIIQMLLSIPEGTLEEKFEIVDLTLKSLKEGAEKMADKIIQQKEEKVNENK